MDLHRAKLADSSIRIRPSEAPHWRRFARHTIDLIASVPGKYVIQSIGTLVCMVGLIMASDNSVRVVRITGTVQAVHATEVRVPLVEGQGGNVTLIRLVKNGVRVHAGDFIAEFDDTSEARLAREAASKYDDLSHQVDQKKAEHISNAPFPRL
jgi:multidrug efflux pump subunit AcrA (membrane-fusion protein)